MWGRGRGARWEAKLARHQNRSGRCVKKAVGVRGRAASWKVTTESEEDSASGAGERWVDSGRRLAAELT